MMKLVVFVTFDVTGFIMHKKESVTLNLPIHYDFCLIRIAFNIK